MIKATAVLGLWALVALAILGVAAIKFLTRKRRSQFWS